MISERDATIGWREWVTLPRLCESQIKAKVDTGAKTSSLHAQDLLLIQDGDQTVAQFELHPQVDSEQGSTMVVAPVVDFRTVRSSNGVTQRRPVIRTEMRLGEHHLEIDLTLTCRAAMDHRMLLGRRMLEDRFVVDPGRSFLITERILS
jgi:hypothetical protein